MRDDIEQLLPWYVNGTLAAAERERVERALTQDASLLAALAFWHSAAQAQQQAAAPAAEDLGLARTLARIRTAAAPASRPAGPRSSLWQRWFAGSWLRPAFALALAVITLQSVLLLDSPRMQYRGAAPDPASAGRPPGAARVTLRVAFDAAATEGQIRIAVTAANAWFVGGPDASGDYFLSVAAEHAEAALAALRESGVVRAAVLAAEAPPPP